MYVSTIGFLGYNLAGAVEVLASLGVETVELNFENLYYLQTGFGSVLGEYRAGLEAAEREGVSVGVIHAPYEDYFAALSGLSVAEWVAEALKLVELAANYDVEVVVFHPFSRRLLGEKVAEFNKAFFGRLSAAAAEKGVSIAIENLYRARPWTDPGRVLELVEGVAGEGVSPGLCLDVGHAFANGFDPAKVVSETGSRIMVTHLHDNDGRWDRHWLPGAGRVDWLRLAEALKRVRAKHVVEVACKADEGEPCTSRAFMASKALASLMNPQ